MQKPTLLVLAAGMGSRYGGLKQVDGVGPNNETIIDYSVYDAIRAGFGKVVFVIRKDIEDLFRATWGDKFSEQIEVEYVFQAVNTPIEGLTDLPERTKPWGTGHAVLVAAEAIKEPFAVVNADDFYGADAFKVMADFLKNQASADHLSMVGYLIGNTLSDNGTVSRGVCSWDDNHYLQTVIERTKIAKDEKDGVIYFEDANQRLALAPDNLVSMNFWGLHPAIFPEIKKQFIQFVKENYDKPKAEFYIPLFVNEMIQNDDAKVTVLQSDAKWYGVTYRPDKPIIQGALEKMVAHQTYPSPLW